MKDQDPGKLFCKFLETIAALRDPTSGCPWDLEQDHRSLRPYLLEEAHEVLQAIDSGDDSALTEELGDLLLQVVLHAQIARDRSAFDVNDIIKTVDQKMIRRHPHIFADAKVDSSEEVLANWEEIKVKEKQGKNSSPETLPYTTRISDIPKSLPALVRAQRIGEKAARFNFDWTSLNGVLGKVREEIGELEEELQGVENLSAKKNSADRARRRLSPEKLAGLEHELGDLLFSLCQLARWLGINAEDALRGTSSRFIERFKLLESSIEQPLEKMSEDELEKAWQEAKQKGFR